MKKIFSVFAVCAALCGLFVSCNEMMAPEMEGKVNELNISQDKVFLVEGDTIDLVCSADITGFVDSSYIWSSDDETVCTVSNKGTVTAVAAGSAIVKCSFGGKSVECKVTVVASSVSCTGISASDQTVFIGSSLKIPYELSPAGCTEAVEVVKKTDDNVIYLGKGGTVKGLSKGSSTLTIKCGSIQKDITVKVTEPGNLPCESISVDPASVALDNDHKTIKLTVTKTPAAATDSVTFESSDTDVVTVAKDGTVTAVADGTATITVSCGEASPVVVPVTATGLNVIPPAADPAGGTFVYAIIMPSSAGVQTAGLSINGTEKKETVLSGAILALDPSILDDLKEVFGSSFTIDSSEDLVLFECTAFEGCSFVKGTGEDALIDAGSYSISAALYDGEGSVIKSESLANLEITDGNVTAVTKRYLDEDFTPAGDPSVPCTAVTVDSATMDLDNLNPSKTITATPVPAATTDTVSFSKTSGDAAISVNSTTGEVTATGNGTAVITVKCGSASAIVTVTATGFPVPSVAVEYDANGGTIDKTSGTYVKESGSIESDFPVATPETGFVFVGWFTLAEGGIEITDSNVEEEIGSLDNVTLYAHWLSE